MGIDDQEKRFKHAIARHWFGALPEEKRDAIIEPHFDEAHPRHEDIVRARRAYQNDADAIGWESVP